MHVAKVNCTSSLGHSLFPKLSLYLHITLCCTSEMQNMCILWISLKHISDKCIGFYLYFQIFPIILRNLFIPWWVYFYILYFWYFLKSQKQLFYSILWYFCLLKLNMVRIIKQFLLHNVVLTYCASNNLGSYCVLPEVYSYIPHLH